jgi:dTDP-4-amino-4,6-dideoxygalactose transaminase
MHNQLAINGGEPQRVQPWHPWPVFDENEERNLLDVLHSGKWSELTGEYVKRFEKAFAEFQQAKYGICVPNGTLALELALRSLDIRPGDEVITTPFTFVATTTTILTVGAVPVYVDIDPDSYNLDINQVEAAVTPKTRAIVPVHLGGRPVDMDWLNQIAQKNRLYILEDACQAWGAEWKGKRVGALGNLGAFSFQLGKNLTAGEGGIVVTNDPDLGERCWSLKNVGRSRSGAWYEHVRLGANLRFPEWEAAILLAQLDRLVRHMPIRDDNTRYLKSLFADFPGLSPLPEDERITSHGRHLVIMRYQSDYFRGKSREEFLAAFRAEGITPVSAGYVPLHQSPAVRDTMRRDHPAYDLNQVSLPIAEAAGKNTIWLNQNALLGSHADMDDIFAAALKIQQAWGS